MEITAIVAPHELHHNDQNTQMHHHHDTKNSKLKKVFTLETYLEFLRTRETQKLTADHLNKIISIHGYKKLSHRKLAEEAVEAITEPINPARSTLKDDIPSSTLSSKAVATLAETIKDLKLLNWQECSITSIRTISFNNCLNPDDDNVPIAEVAAKLMALKSNKRCKLSAPVDTSSMTMMSNGNGLSKESYGSGACSSSSSKLPPIGIKKKTRNKRVYLKKLLYSPHAVTALASPVTFK
ncbi:uncharacterized protein LOC141611473 [Silene latifolia]|uniref:uncharacterized protein LOC141611473 n=1 Tax=Silene latifolia TaxID=37657 RepID=UPI003D773CD6